MKPWHQYPFIRLVILLFIGTIVALHVDKPLYNTNLALLILVLLFGLLAISLRIRFKFSTTWIPGILIAFILFVAAYINTTVQTPKFKEDSIIHAANQPLKLLVQITEPLTEKPNSYKVLARAIGFQDSIVWRRTSGQLLLYFEKDSSVDILEYGDQIIIQTRLNLINPPQNPNEFDYRKYLSNKGIYSQGYVRSGFWAILERNKGNPIYKLGYSLRERFSKILENNGIEGKEFSVASAILLGYDEYLDSDQRKDFAGAGAMHILCVSGLHVGIIYVILNNLLLFLNRKRVFRISKVVLMLLLIWTYALITGLSPSVLRASTMFSFIIVGNSMKRKPNIYNSIAASAFVLMIINPTIITQVGFQLSYLAVLGIVLLYKPIVNLFVPGNFIVRWIWQISVVSIAATFATFPLSLFYFHQFPNLFLITNLVAIPASMLIIYTGILVLIFSPISFLSGLFAKVLAGIIWILNFSVNWIEGLAHSVSEGVYINGIEMFLLFGISVSIVALILKVKKIYIYYILTFLVVLLMSFTIRKYKSLNQKMMVVYSINKTTALDFISQKDDILVTDSLLNSNKRGYHIQNFQIASGIKNHKTILVNEKVASNSFLQMVGGFIQFYDKRLILIGEEFSLYETEKKVPVDYIIISGNPYLQIKDLKDSFIFDKVIFDASNTFWNTRKWIKECNDCEIEFYDVKASGAWIVSI